jgi:hypothetical protein
MQNEPEINHGHCKTQNAQSEELYQYEGLVYCLEVPSHVFMIRQIKECMDRKLQSLRTKGTNGFLLQGIVSGSNLFTIISMVTPLFFLRK